MAVDEVMRGCVAAGGRGREGEAGRQGRHMNTAVLRSSCKVAFHIHASDTRSAANKSQTCSVFVTVHVAAQRVKQSSRIPN